MNVTNAAGSSALVGLNDEQLQAATAADGPVLIVAGPGTGKTKTLTSRIAYLLQSGVAPDEIVALTFTNKTAKEMRERLRGMLGGGQAALPIIATFHALAPQLTAMTEQNQNIVPDSERQTIITSIKETQRLAGSARDIGLQLSQAKSRLAPIDAALQPVITAYNEALAARGLRDFDDVLLDLCAALEDPERVTRQFEYVLIDEFQDTNEIQYEIVRRLARANNIFAIGDPLQSIYGFRGATAAIFDRFSIDLPEVRVIRLTTNYRSRPEIVDVTNAFFSETPPLTAYRREPGIARTMELLNEYREADWLVEEIERRIGGSTMLAGSTHHATDEGRTFRDFAILYRTHAVARTIQRALEASGLPYQVAGEGSPYERPAVQAILQALHYIHDGNPAPVGSLTASQTQHLLKPLKGRTFQLPALVEEIIKTLVITDDTSALQQFRNSLLPHADTSLPAYLTHVQLLREQAYYDSSAEAITLSTIHAAKGLEFPCVFVLACEEGILPHMREGKSSATDEERRLMYVAASRARDELHLLHARKRGGKPGEISSFIRDLPRGIVIRKIDPQMTAQQQAAKRRQLKRSQGTLF